MRKTISLRVTSQEEELIDSMRKKGISPSVIIREAFKKYIKEDDAKNREKQYKDVNHVNHFQQGKKKEDNRKAYNVVNHVNQNVNKVDDFLREKVVYNPVNHVNQSQAAFLDQYVYQLQRHIQQLDSELHDWKTRYAMEMLYWKETYQSLQTEYQNNVKDSTKRIDDRFDQIMFYIEECRKSPPQTFEIPTTSENRQEILKKRWTPQNVRM